MIVLNILGIISSIIGCYIAIRKNDNKNKYIYTVIIILCIVAATTSYLYRQEVNEKLQIEERKRTLKIEAKKQLDKIPFYISPYDTGKNEGVLYSIFVLLEGYKDLYPDTYEIYRKSVIQRIEDAQKLDDISRGYKIQEAADAAKQLVKSLSE